MDKDGETFTITLNDEPISIGDVAYPEHSDSSYTITLDGTPLAEPTYVTCLLYTSPSPRDATLSRMPSSA